MINRYPEIGDDAFVTVILTDNDAGGSISMLIVFELHAVAVDNDKFQKAFQYLEDCFYQQHFARSGRFFCPNHILFSSSHYSFT